jgi:hypothetical protein
MFQQNKTKILGLGATPTLPEGMPKRNQARSSQMQMFESSKAMKRRSYKDLIGIDLLVEQCEVQEWLIQDQSIQVKELQKRLKDYEEELYQKENRYSTTKNVGYTTAGI